MTEHMIYDGSSAFFPIYPEGVEPPAADYISVYRGGKWYAEKPSVGMVEPAVLEQQSRLWHEHPILVSFTGNLLALAVYWLVTQ